MLMNMMGLMGGGSGTEGTEVAEATNGMNMNDMLTQLGAGTGGGAVFTTLIGAIKKILSKA